MYLKKNLNFHPDKQLTFITWIRKQIMFRSRKFSEFVTFSYLDEPKTKT